MIHPTPELIEDTFIVEEFTLDRGFTGLEEQYGCVESGLVRAEWLHRAGTPFTGNDREYQLYRKGRGRETKFLLYVDGGERKLTRDNLSEFVSNVWIQYYRYDELARRRNSI